jgi:hypothetical protein
MNYEKPNVVLVASAVDAVKGVSKSDDPIDSSNGLTVASAYESDE